ncbi:hypothetical protein V6N11_010793 [Hibiscus sabdariffa]|uniref:Uncharacterized protein n=1 Tax=Hibiscus sabdariffa TaxID=183260 RepID=A0ABR2S767_9ROSI
MAADELVRRPYGGCRRAVRWSWRGWLRSNLKATAVVTAGAWPTPGTEGVARGALSVPAGAATRACERA